MNKLHKIIFSLSALFVAICVLYGGAYAAGNETQFSAVKDSVSGEKLNVLGIVTDDEAAQDSAANITRAEFTAWTLRALNKTNSAAKESYFGDVPSDYWAAGYINLAYELGFVSGAENFEPAREITYDEALKIAVAAVDYEAVAEINGGYPDGYRYAARQSGIIKNVSITGTDGLTKAQAAVMIDNLLGTELINSYEYTHGGDAKTGETPLSKYFNVTIYRGIIEEVNVKDRQIRIITDGVSALYDVSDRVNINKVIEDDSEIYVQETDAEEKVIYIKQKGKANVMYDYITAVNKNYAAIDNTPIPQPEGISEKASVLSEENSKLVQKVTELEKSIKEKDSEISDLNEKITESEITEYRNNILFNAYTAKQSGDTEKVKEILSELSYDSLNEQQQAAYNELMK